MRFLEVVLAVSDTSLSGVSKAPSDFTGVALKDAVDDLCEDVVEAASLEPAPIFLHAPTSCFASISSFPLGDPTDCLANNFLGATVCWLHRLRTSDQKRCGNLCVLWHLVRQHKLRQLLRAVCLGLAFNHESETVANDADNSRRCERLDGDCYARCREFVVLESRREIKLPGRTNVNS